MLGLKMGKRDFILIGDVKGLIRVVMVEIRGEDV